MLEMYIKSMELERGRVHEIWPYIRNLLKARYADFRNTNKISISIELSNVEITRLMELMDYIISENSLPSEKCYASLMLKKLTEAYNDYC